MMRSRSRLFDRGRAARRARGFTLLEILVALAVLAIALTAGLHSLGQAVDSADALRDRLLGQWLAEDRLVRYQIDYRWPAIDTTDGETEHAGRTWRWREQVSATPVAKLRRIDITVMSPGAGDPVARITGFLRQP